MDDPKDNYQLYMKNAQEMLDVAEENFSNQRYSTACNRAYYGIFYAASALLFSKGKSYGKHSAVLAAFANTLLKRASLIKSGATIMNLLWIAVTPPIMSCTTLWRKKMLL